MPSRSNCTGSIDRYSNSNYYILKLDYDISELPETYILNMSSTGQVKNVTMKSIKINLYINKTTGMLYRKETTEEYNMVPSLLNVTLSCSGRATTIYTSYDEILEMGVTPEKAPDKFTLVKLGFTEGIPTSIDDKEMSLLDIITYLNEIGGQNGIGILDMVENRLVGMKSRGVYETPGGTIIYKAHELLESICLDKDLFHEKQHIALKIGNLLYNAKFYSPLMESYLAFVDKASENVSGTVKLKLYKGNIICMGIESPNSLHSLGISSFENDDDYNQYDAQGFVNIYGLSNRIMAKKGGK